MSKDRNIIVDGMSYGERELAQLIRRRMMTQEIKNKKIEHKGAFKPEELFKTDSEEARQNVKVDFNK